MRERWRKDSRSGERHAGGIGLEVWGLVVGIGKVWLVELMWIAEMEVPQGRQRLCTPTVSLNRPLTQHRN